MKEKHGKNCGHASKITDVAYSGDILITKDPNGMRLFRASGDFAMLRVVTAKGRHVSIHPCGQFLVTGTRRGEGGGADINKSPPTTMTDDDVRGKEDGEEGAKEKEKENIVVIAQKTRRVKVWGPGGSSCTVRKKSITTGAW